jgi:uncharacterized protein (DUF305 family)
MRRAYISLAAIALVGVTALRASAQAPAKPAACTPEHAKMGHCKTETPAPDHSKMDHSKMDHSKMGHGAAAPAAGDSASTTAFKAVNDKMHAGMAIPFTGNADIDFAKGMIPHHQGAVEMAKVVLQYGKDPAMKKLARDIIKAQDKEIAFMQRWLAKSEKTAKK